MTQRDLTVEAARAVWMDVLERGPTTTVRVARDGSVPPELNGRPALAQSLSARWSLPNAPTSVMDGYAVRAAELDGTTRLRVHDESAAGHPTQATLRPGDAIPVSTGAVVPHGADAVVPVEDTSPHDDGTVTINVTTTSGRFVRPAGSDVEAASVLLPAGAAIGPGELALLLSAGHAELPIVRPPRVAVVCTGDELLRPGDEPGPGQVISTNGPMLVLQIERAGGRALPVVHAPDTLDETIACIRESAASAELLLTSGGISVGRHDLVLGALERLGAEILVRKVRMKPGRPCTFARLGTTPVLALPGNPASSLVSFELFGRPAIRKLGGHASWGPTLHTRVLGETVRSEQSREHWVRARLDEDGAVRLLTAQASGALRSIAAFEVLARIPPGLGELSPGTEISVLDPESRR
jgi:molybdopterin molybdotransferase